MQVWHLENDKARTMGIGRHAWATGLLTWQTGLSLSEGEHPVAPSHRPSPTGVVGSVRPSESHHRRNTSALSLLLGLMLTLLRDSVDRDTPASALVLTCCSIVV